MIQTYVTKCCWTTSFFLGSSPRNESDFLNHFCPIIENSLKLLVLWQEFSKNNLYSDKNYVLKLYKLFTQECFENSTSEAQVVSQGLTLSSHLPATGKKKKNISNFSVIHSSFYLSYLLQNSGIISKMIHYSS